MLTLNMSFFQCKDKARYTFKTLWPLFNTQTSPYVQKTRLPFLSELHWKRNGQSKHTEWDNDQWHQTAQAIVWSLAVPLGIANPLARKKEHKIGKYPSVNISRMPMLHTVLMDELQSNKRYLTSLIRQIVLLQQWGSLPPKLTFSGHNVTWYRRVAWGTTHERRAGFIYLSWRTALPLRPHLCYVLCISLSLSWF